MVCRCWFTKSRNRPNIELTCRVCYIVPSMHVPSKHETLNQCWVNVCPPSTTAAQHWFKVSCLSGSILYRRVWKIAMAYLNLHKVVCFFCIKYMYIREVCRLIVAHPANTGHSPYAVSMLGHRLRRWPNIKTASGECPVFAGQVTVTLVC